MLLTRYCLVDSQSEITLRAESAAVLDATKSLVEDVAKTNPARAELLEQLSLTDGAINTGLK